MHLTPSLPCIDKITRIEKGKRVLARRTVQPTEEFFQDHFVDFPVLPGALILEGLVQTSAWHVRLMEDFENSQVRMVECSLARFNQLVKPGAELEFDSELVSSNPPYYDFKGKVSEQGKTVASARFRIASHRIDKDSIMFGHLEDPINEKSRQIFALLNSSNTP